MILLVAAPVALTVFFIPYGLYAGRIFGDELLASSQVVDGLMYNKIKGLKWIWSIFSTLAFCNGNVTKI